MPQLCTPRGARFVTADTPVVVISAGAAVLHVSALSAAVPSLLNEHSGLVKCGREGLPGWPAEQAILPENPWQLPVIGHRSSLDGRGVRGADGQLEKLGKFPGNDPMIPVGCAHHESVMSSSSAHVLVRGCVLPTAPSTTPGIPPTDFPTAGGLARRLSVG